MLKLLVMAGDLMAAGLFLWCATYTDRQRIRRLVTSRPGMRGRGA